SRPRPPPLSLHDALPIWIIPNRIVVPAAAIVLVANSALTLSPQWVIGAFAAAGFLLAAALAYPAGMGMGDVKLALLMGAALGKRSEEHTSELQSPDHLVW